MPLPHKIQPYESNHPAQPTYPNISPPSVSPQVLSSPVTARPRARPPIPPTPARIPSEIPTPLTSASLPAKYKPAERRVRLIIIALPIAIVTSYMLYKRLILGEERKILVRLDMAKKREP